MRSNPLRPAVVAGMTLLLALVAAAPADAQRDGRCTTFWETMGAAHLDLDRAAALTGAREFTTEAGYRGGEALARRCGGWPEKGAPSGAEDWLGLPEVAVLPAAMIAQFNSAYPRYQRDGLRWASRGVSTAVTAGAHGRWGPLSAAVAPVVSWHSNASFDTHVVATPGLSQYGNFYHAGRIDAPQRFGPDGALWVHTGQSFLRADAYGATAGVSTETLRWGPARRNPLLMSGAAPGFFHAFAGTSAPADIRIGRLEVEAVWGRLEESAYFDTIPDNDHRLLAGLVVAFSPGETGLTLGAARVYSRHIPPDGISFGDLVFGPYVGVRENPRAGQGVPDNQLLSVFFRWAFPAVGFEVYGEYARDDHWEDSRDLLMEPDHSRAYTIGLQHVFTLDGRDRRLRVAAEATNLNTSPTWQSRGLMTNFYTHSRVRQGHTHRGQLLGAPIGTGSDAQYLAADYLTPRLLLGASLERARYDNDAYYLHLRHPYGYRGHDTELSAALRAAAFLHRDFQAMGEVGYATRYNRGFVGLPGTLSPTLTQNITVILGLAWAPAVGPSGP